MSKDPTWPKEIVVCLKCGAVKEAPEHMFREPCAAGGMHGPTQTVSVVPASVAAELAEALKEVASCCPDSEWTRETLEKVLVSAVRTAESALTTYHAALGEAASE